MNDTWLHQKESLSHHYSEILTGMNLFVSLKTTLAFSVLCLKLAERIFGFFTFWRVAGVEGSDVCSPFLAYNIVYFASCSVT